MIKSSFFSTNESFFGQSILLCFPILAFSGSLELALSAGALSLCLIYLTALLFTLIRPQVEKNLWFPICLGLAVTSGAIVSALSFYLYPAHFSREGYLINLFFISLLYWQRNLFTSVQLDNDALNQELLPSLLWILLPMGAWALLREGLGTGSFSFFGVSLFLIPVEWTIPFLSKPLGAFLGFFLSVIVLKIAPSFYENEKMIDPFHLPPVKRKNPDTLLERTSRLESLLSEGLSKK
jgi:hypothetical protein